MDKTLTRVGLPNSCMLCGQKVLPADGWYADNDDAARAGSAICAEDYAKLNTLAQTHEPQTNDDDGKSTEGPEVGPGAPADIDLAGMTVAHLKDLAAARSVALKSSMNKAEIVAAIAGAADEAS